MFSTRVGATTVEAWTTMPRNANYHPSQRSAISARASTTWLPTAQSKHNSPHQVLRENRPPRKETRRSTATRHRLPRPLIKREIGQHWRRGSTEANHTALMERWDTRAPSSRWSCFGNYLRLKKNCSWRMLLKFFVCLFSFGVTLRNTAVLLHSGRFLNVWITAVLSGIWDCSEQCHITDYLDEFL